MRIAEDGDSLVVELHTDADQKSPRMRQDQDDRVGALGGQLMVGPDYLRAEIPCVP